MVARQDDVGADEEPSTLLLTSDRDRIWSDVIEEGCPGEQLSAASR